MYYASLLFAYLVGAIPFGFIVYKHRTGRDIRRVGSGNIGATNVMRTLGKTAAATVLAADALKGSLSAWFGAHAHALGGAGALTLTSREAAAAAGVLAILGHAFPVYLGFRGGKGVATAFGVFLVVCPGAMLAVVALFALLVALTRYVSLGSVAGALALPLFVRYLYPGEPRVLAAAAVVAAVVVARHAANVARLLRGTEKRLGDRPAPPAG